MFSQGACFRSCSALPIRFELKLKSRSKSKRKDAIPRGLLTSSPTAGPNSVAAGELREPACPRPWPACQSRLGSLWPLPYRRFVIGLLRFIGLMNAAVWFGAAFFFTFGAEPALRNSQEIQRLLQPEFYPYYSVALAQLVAVRFFHLYLVCSLLALLHLVAEWLYLGKYPRRLWLGMLLGLCLAGWLQVFFIQPQLQSLHHHAFGAPAQRESARRAFAAWQTAVRGLNLALLCGVGVYLWRVANPPDPMRFIPAGKFRS
jgi:hypothetical protein